MSNKEKAIKMYRSGKMIKEIAEELGIAQVTVKNFVHGIKVEPTHVSNQEEFTMGWNQNRKGCQKCIYRCKASTETTKKRPGCNYINVVGHSRGCKVDDCNVFVKESRKKK